MKNVPRSAPTGGGGGWLGPGRRRTLPPSDEAKGKPHEALDG